VTLKGKTIQIYCPAGDPRGVRIAEITTSIPQAVVVPRVNLESALEREELSQVGLYLLFGPTENTDEEQVYIGEADDCCERLRFHGADEAKRFWQTAVAIVSSKGSLTKAHGRLLEHWAIQKARAAERYEVVNGTSPKKPPTPEAMEAECQDIFEVAQVLLNTLGFPVFEPLVPLVSQTTAASDASNESYHLSGAGYSAKMVRTADGYVVLKGGVGRTEFAKSVVELYTPRREELVAQGVLRRTEAGFEFMKDHAFKSPSAAAGIVSGSSANGWDAWVDSGGRTLDEVVRKATK